MKKFNDMVKHTRVKFSQRPRMRTSTKLVMVFSFFSIVSIVCMLFFLLNISTNTRTMGGDVMPAPVAVNGMQQVREKKLMTDFEVQTLDTMSYTRAKEGVVLFKKMK